MSDEQQWADAGGRELRKIAAENGGNFSSAQVIAWARVHPDSALHAMFDWCATITDEQRAAEFDSCWPEHSRH